MIVRTRLSPPNCGGNGILGTVNFVAYDSKFLLEEKFSWPIPRLEFSGTPLKEVIAKINRHNRQQFVIADPTLENLALSGILRADKTDALVKMLESEFYLIAERRAQQIILRRAR